MKRGPASRSAINPRTPNRLRRAHSVSYGFVVVRYLVAPSAQKLDVRARHLDQNDSRAQPSPAPRVLFPYLVRSARHSGTMALFGFRSVNRFKHAARVHVQVSRRATRLDEVSFGEPEFSCIGRTSHLGGCAKDGPAARSLVKSARIKAAME